MKFRMMSVALLAMLLVAALTPAAFADTIIPARVSVTDTGGGGPPPIAWRALARAPRQVSGLPWSRVWVERNLFRNRGR